MFDEMSDERPFRSIGHSFARRERRSEGFASGDADWDVRTEFGGGLAEGVEIDSLD